MNVIVGKMVYREEGEIVVDWEYLFIVGVVVVRFF